MLLALDDFERAARQRLPKALFGFVAGGCETDAALTGNREQFRAWSLRPRVLVGATTRIRAVTLFGQTFAAPFGIAPMGGSGLSAYRADAVLARAAARARIPYVLSGASSIHLEKVREENPSAWFQAYLPHDREAKRGLAERLARAGYDVLVVTVDMTLPGNRENNLRNGFSMPVRPNWRLARDCLTRPRWFAQTFCKTLWRDGGWRFENQGPTRGGSMLKPPPTGTRRGHEALDWNDIRFMREVWKGRLLLKGILAHEDARLAAAIGIDGVIVSNHGGRQLDEGLAPLHALPAVVDAAGEMAVLFDGGVRRGGDVIKALALGARMVLVGRPFLYGAVVGGEPGVERVAAILDEELDRDLALLGCPNVADLSPEFLASAVRAQTEPRLDFEAQRIGVSDGSSRPRRRGRAS